MSENDLRPCPFCPDGGDLQLVTFTGGADDVVHCHECGTILKHKIWQTRPIEDELQKRIAELEAEAKAVKENSQWLARLTESSRKENEHLRQTLSVYAAKQRWIPVSERLPDTKIVYDKFDVIVEFEDIENGVMTRCVELMSYDYRNKSWNDDCWEFGFYPVAGVTHWRERPTPPEVQE